MNIRKERKLLGKALRQQVPFNCHANWTASETRSDPVDLLQAQDEGRLKRYLPIKYGRMLDSPYAFFRGSAVLMAADLSGTRDTGIYVTLCGDAHLSNFGLFATPERRLVFDINDFDEVYPGPWEWDLKRLATSAIIAGRDNGFTESECLTLALTVAKSYSWAIAYFAKIPTMDLWYYHIKAKEIRASLGKVSEQAEKSARKMVRKARTHTHEQTLHKLTVMEDSQRRIISNPPLLVPLRNMNLKSVIGETELEKITEETVQFAWTGYLNSLPDERRFLLERFEIVDVAFRVGGIGSVGTRCVVVLLNGGTKDDYLLLQLKEAKPSVLAPYLATYNYESQAQRVVTGQRLMQASSDIFLGWHRGQITKFEFYWRQLKDMKSSAKVSDLKMNGLQAYLALCAWCLARAHARTGDEVKINGYLGRKDEFYKAIADFAVLYADQVERDYHTLLRAAKSGRVPVEIRV